MIRSIFLSPNLQRGWGQWAVLRAVVIVVLLFGFGAITTISLLQMGIFLPGGTLVFSCVGCIYWFGLHQRYDVRDTTFMVLGLVLMYMAFEHLGREIFGSQEALALVGGFSIFLRFFSVGPQK